MIVDFDKLKKLSEPFIKNCPVCGRACERKVEAGFFPIYFHGGTMCSQYPSVAEYSVQRMAGTWRKFINFVGHVAGSFRRLRKAVRQNHA